MKLTYTLTVEVPETDGAPVHQDVKVTVVRGNRKAEFVVKPPTEPQFLNYYEYAEAFHPAMDRIVEGIAVEIWNSL